MTTNAEYNALLSHTDHRPWPLSAGRWMMAQTWHDLLFAHWRIPLATMRALVPPELDLDLFGGEAWLGVVPFRMSGVRPRITPPVGWISDFLELNLRTYVTLDGKPGVCFFGLEAEQPLAVEIARAWFRLPYFHARMGLQRNGEAIVYRSERTHRGYPPARFAGEYAPTGPVYAAVPGTLEHWLTERYCLYAVQGGRVWRGEIHHKPWPLQPAEARITENTIASAAGFTLPGEPPVLHFARRIDVVVWSLARVR